MNDTTSVNFEIPFSLFPLQNPDLLPIYTGCADTMPHETGCIYCRDGNFKSRGRAKTAIVAGNVKVNGTAVTKASRDVSTADVIEVTEGLDQPQGYFKLKLIQEESGILKPGDRVLDLGSSAGGFLLFASEIAGHVKGIEFGRDFRSELGKIAYEKENIEVMFGDVFTVPLSSLSEEPVDVILSDMTLEPEDSIKALSRVLPLLKSGASCFRLSKFQKRKTLNPS